MQTYYSVYIKRDNDRAIWTYTFKDETRFRDFLHGAEEDGTYWGQRITDEVPTEYTRDEHYAPPVLMW